MYYWRRRNVLILLNKSRGEFTFTIVPEITEEKSTNLWGAIIGELVVILLLLYFVNYKKETE